MMMDDTEQRLLCHEMPKKNRLHVTRETINYFSREQVWVDDGKVKL